MQFQYVISIQQQPSAAEARAEAIAEAQAAAAQARAEAARIRDVQRDVRQQIREQIQQQIHIGQGQGLGIGQGPGGEPVIMVPPPHQNDIPPHVMEDNTIFVVAAVICMVGLPIARAIGRWIDRRGLPSPVNAEMAAQMNRIEQAVDTMSVEVERISEAQRYQAKLLVDREKVQA